MTTLTYLHEPDAGGATTFDRLGLAIPPRRGSWWPSRRRRGSPPPPRQLHAGAPVEAGVSGWPPCGSGARCGRLNPARAPGPGPRTSARVGDGDRPRARPGLVLVEVRLVSVQAQVVRPTLLGLKVRSRSR